MQSASALPILPAFVILGLLKVRDLRAHTTDPPHCPGQRARWTLRLWIRTWRSCATSPSSMPRGVSCKQAVQQRLAGAASADRVPAYGLC